MQLSLCVGRSDLVFNMQRSLPSSSSNKRKRQDAFIDASPFDAATPRRVAVNSAATRDATALDLDPQRHKVTPSSVTAGSRGKNEGSKPKGIMAFSPMTRGLAGMGKALPETPSQGFRISSPGLPVPTGFTLLRPPALPSPAHTESASSARGGLEKAGGSKKGSLLARNAMTPLSSLTAQARANGSPSPAAGLSKNKNFHPLAQPDLFASRRPSGNEGMLLERSEGGLPIMPHTTVLSIAQAQQVRSTTIEPEHLISMNSSSRHEMTRSKGKAAG
ncbi:hypothetical protein QFC21_002978 [Naganishia friedmannii]|uniref:Uncharacterized protein n=1 Tax=Naganishia friedmannii TaxID=89922 RepID=A0ACC2VTB5_9TREE|nr:hypothetical protein QFC21_002978 [Naganishia friedmannii]